MEERREGERKERKIWRNVHMKIPTPLHVGDIEGVREQHRQGG